MKQLLRFSRWPCVVAMLLALVAATTSAVVHDQPSVEELLKKARAHCDDGDYATALPILDEVINLLQAPDANPQTVASQIATAINARAQPQGPSVAFAIDDRTIRVTIPASERADRAGFLADVMSADVNASLLDLPAQVIVNPRTGSIIVTGDVEISPVAITQKDLNITTTIPAPVGTAINPLVRRDRWTTLETAMKPAEGAKLSDLIAAFKQLDIPVAEQINILQMLHKTGKLQARLVID